MVPGMWDDCQTNLKSGLVSPNNIIMQFVNRQADPIERDGAFFHDILAQGLWDENAEGVRVSGFFDTGKRCNIIDMSLHDMPRQSGIGCDRSFQINAGTGFELLQRRPGESFAAQVECCHASRIERLNRQTDAIHSDALAYLTLRNARLDGLVPGLLTAGYSFDCTHAPSRSREHPPALTRPRCLSSGAYRSP